MVRQTKLALGGNPQLKLVDGDLLVKNTKVKDIVDLYGTPTFLFNNDLIITATKTIQEIFEKVFNDQDSNRSRTKGFYSVKSNFLSPILSSINSTGFGFEIITEPELNLIKRMGFDPKMILCGGPYLPSSMMESAIGYGVEEFVVYDLQDLPILNSVASSKGIHVRVILRFIQDKYQSRLGITNSDENFVKLKSIMGGCTNIRFVGILNHYGSQMNSVEGYRKNGQFLVGIANSLLEKCGIKISVFNIGGGFPESFVIPKNHFMDYLQEMKQIFSETGWGECSVYYEPGRYIVGGAGFLLASIVKKNEEFRTYFLDVGINIIPQFARSSLRFHNVDKICEEAQEKYDIMGIVPSDQDILAKNYNFQNTSEVGDKVIISGVGAYTITFSTRFPYQFPTILFCENDEISVFRSRGDSEDVSLY